MLDTTAWDPVEVLYVGSQGQLIFGARNPGTVPLREPLGGVAR
ncbi:hypothetical protein OG471_05095 [Streptomyces sp. NBC_01336]|nr:hypothetical protein OG471_05095 [Streptomyces sp. NBC_01336]